MPIGATQARECLCWAPVLRLCLCLGVTPPRHLGGRGAGVCGRSQQLQGPPGGGAWGAGLSAGQPGAGGAQARPGGGPGFQPCLHLLLTLLPWALCWLFLGLVISEVGIMISRIASHDSAELSLEVHALGGRGWCVLERSPSAETAASLSFPGGRRSISCCGGWCRLSSGSTCFWL